MKATHLKTALMAAGLAVAFGQIGALPAIAHEGHDVPGSIQAQHGGVVKPTKDLYLELAQEGNVLMLYPMTHEFKPVPLSEVKVTATAQLARSKKKEPVALKAHESQDPAQAHYMGSFDAKGAHRFTLEVQTEYKGKKEKQSFQVEPRS